MSLFEELIEDTEKDKDIIKSFISKDRLTDQIFEMIDGKNYIMRDDVRKALLKVSDKFIGSLGVEFFIHDIILTGSLANYNWSEFSDVDLHIVIDYKESKYSVSILEEFFDAKTKVWNEKHDIVIKGFDVEFYVQDIDHKMVSSGVYSILNGKWIVVPKKDKPQIDDSLILRKGEYYSKMIDDLIKLSKKEDVLSKIDDLRKKLKSFRQCGLDKGGEYSYENLTFKLLRRNGYIEKLMNLKTNVIDKKLSLPQ